MTKTLGSLAAEFGKFAVVGFSGSIVDFGAYTALTRVAHVYYLYATAVSVLIAICVSVQQKSDTDGLFVKT